MPGAIIKRNYVARTIAGVAAVEFQPFQRLIGKIDLIASAPTTGPRGVDSGVRVIGGLGLRAQFIKCQGHREGLSDLLAKPDFLAALPGDERSAGAVRVFCRRDAAQIIAVKAAPRA